MSTSLLSVQQLSVGVEQQHILKDINLEIAPGETHVLMGPNGTGKSSFGYTLAGNPNYIVHSGNIFFQGQDITHSPVEDRAKNGLFLSFQNPLEIPGITVESFLKTIYEQHTGKRISAIKFHKLLLEAMATLQIPETYAHRDFNVGFSGGEKKKMEMLQLLVIKPTLAILDETDSGLDVDAVRTVSKAIETYQNDYKGTLLIITHSTRILESLQVDKTHVMIKGTIVKTGDHNLVEEINAKGFEAFGQEGTSHE